MRALLWIGLVAAMASAAVAQPQSKAALWRTLTEEALAEARLDDARRAVENLVDLRPSDASAHFLRACVLVAQGDTSRAARAVARAVDRAPENVRYLELQLALGFPNEPLSALRNQRREDVARRIMALDSLSAGANLQLGYEYAADGLFHAGKVRVRGRRPVPSAVRGGLPAAGTPTLGTDPGRLADRTSDPFDLERQRAMGRLIQDVSGPGAADLMEAERHLRQALAAAPERLAAYRLLALVVLAREGGVAPGELADLAAQARAHRPHEPFGWMLGGYAAWRTGDAASAEALFAQALDRLPASLQERLHDPQQLMNRRTEALLAEAGFTADAFWEARDPLYLTPENERRLEHLARVVYADLAFGSLDDGRGGPRVRGWDTERGAIWIRYGPPTREVRLEGAMADCGPGTVTDFHVFEHPFGRFVFGRPPGAAWHEHILYSPCANALGSYAALNADLDYVTIAGNHITRQPERYEPAATGPPPLAEAYRLRGPGGRLEVIAAYGVPLPYRPQRGDLALALRVGAFLVHPVDGLVERQERTVGAIPAEAIRMLDEGALWTGALVLLAGPEAHEVSVEYATGGEGRVRASVRVPVEAAPIAPEGVSLSDIVVVDGLREAAMAAPHELLRYGWAFAPAPQAVVGRGEPLRIYAEAYDLTPDAEGRTRFSVEAALVEAEEGRRLERLVRRAFGRRGGVAARFEAEGAGGTEAVPLVIDVDDRAPGRYVLVLRVRDRVSGAEAEARRAVEVR